MTERAHHTGDQLILDLQTWAGEYADSSNGIMQALPYDPEKYPAQDSLYCVGEPGAGAVVDGIAEIAQPRYHEALTLLRDQEEQTGLVSMAGELLAGGNNVELVTNHSDLIDIAVAQAALYSTLVRENYSMKTGIIISKMVAFLAYKLGDDFAPCNDVLKILESETYLSYPKTESTKKHLKDRLLPTKIDRHNRKLRDHITDKLGEGGLLLAMAASGTTDKLSPTNPSTMVMSKIGHGTMELMQQPRTYVLPMAIWYKGEQVVMEICDIPRVIKDETMAHGAMERIADTLTNSTEDLNFVYAG